MGPDATGRARARHPRWPRGRGRAGPALAPPADVATVARARRGLHLRARRLRRRALDEPERRRRLWLAAPLVFADARVSRTRSRPEQARRVGLRLRRFVALRCAHRRCRRISRSQRNRSPLGRPARRRVLDAMAAARRRDRRSSRVGELTVGRRCRPAQLQRAALDAARDDRRCAPPLAAADADASRARRLRVERRDVREGVERAARCRRARRRVPARPQARRAAVPRRRARARAARPRLLADLVPEAVRQPAIVAARPVRRGTRRHELDALVDLHAAHARDRRCRSRSSVRSACGARGRSRSCSRSC